MLHSTDDIVPHLLEHLRPKAKSLLITVYGDAIAHHGGNAWLGSLVTLARPLGLNERLVRTSAFRLAKENWLLAQPVGRRSYYRLTEAGARRFATAHDRIYHYAQRPWDRGWTVVIPGATELSADIRATLRRDLGWLGFGTLAGGVMLHPDPDETALRALLADIDNRALVVQGPAALWVAPETLSNVIRTCWDLDRLATDYARFLDIFRPVWQLLREAEALEPELGFCVRTLLMHGYRRAILRDPMLPAELLPVDWPGAAARVLCGNLYRRVEAAGERHVIETLETPEGPVPDAHPSYFERFGGLRGPAQAIAPPANAD